MPARPPVILDHIVDSVAPHRGRWRVILSMAPYRGRYRVILATELAQVAHAFKISHREKLNRFNFF